MLGNIILFAAILAILHAAYSTYEHLSYLKALGRPEASLPQDIVIEALTGLSLAIVGSAIRTPELREVTWRSEMKRRATEEQDPRLAFAVFARRAGIIPASSSS